MKITTKAENQQITDVSSDIYTTLNVMYILTLACQKLIREEKSQHHADRAFRASVSVIRAAKKWKSLIRKPTFHEDTVEMKSPLQAHSTFTNKKAEIAIAIDIDNDLSESFIPASLKR